MSLAYQRSETPSQLRAITALHCRFLLLGNGLPSLFYIHVQMTVFALFASISLCKRSNSLIPLCHYSVRFICSLLSLSIDFSCMYSANTMVD